MKRKTALIALTALFLTSCGSKPPEPPEPVAPTYTITIGSTSHFTPSKTSFTFSENDFTPITFSYTTDSNWFVNAVSVDKEENADCTFDPVNKQITVTPKINTDFVITASVLSLSTHSFVSFVSMDGRFHPDVAGISFENDDFKTGKIIHYTLDQYYIVDKFEYETDKLGVTRLAGNSLSIKLKQNGEHLIKVFARTMTKTIAFDPGDGGTLWESAKSTIKVTCGHELGEFIDEYQGATKEGYNFKGWSYTSGGKGEIVNLEDIVDENTPTTLYASYERNIVIDSESLYVRSIYDGDTLLIIYLGLQDSQKYQLPYDLSKFHATSATGEKIDIYAYEKFRPDSAALFIVKSGVVESGEINLTVEDYQPKYSAYFYCSDNRISPVIPLAENNVPRGENFSFDIKVNNPENATGYYIPDKLKIQVGGIELSSEGYRLGVKDSTRQEGTVTIYGEYIRDNINISCEAGQEDYYMYDFTGLGVEVGGESYVEGISKGDEETILNFDEKVSITKDNVGVNINNEQWYILSDESFPYSDIISITITDSGVKITPDGTIPDDIRSISLIVADPEYSVFEHASWSQIEEISNGGLAKTFFTIGEKKVVFVDCEANVAYDVRIIGFDHDTIYEKSKDAGITIEFEQLITDNNYILHKGAQGTWLAGFEDEVYDRYLNETFLNGMNEDMQMVIKKVKKPIKPFHPETNEEYYTKVFPLSCTEIGYNGDIKEGSTYEFYKGKDKSCRKKNAVQGDASSSYWLRTVSTSRSLSSYVKKDGSIGEAKKSDNLGYMAAFCV